ncbi:hypothetical protein C8J57DRAFT_643980 [Mycena rebaudengoi]|nr:hypothetical protein C8J57DRAFT_643980 [Mycena rebaudengoi]
MATFITPISAIPSSPTVSSASSFDMVSRSRSSTASSQSFEVDFPDSDDEIVWSVSEEDSPSSSDQSATGSASPISDGDFVVLSLPQSPYRAPSPTTDGANTPNNLAADLARLTVSNVSASIRRNKRAAALRVQVPQRQDGGDGHSASHKRRSKTPAATPTQAQTGGSTPSSDRPSSVATLRKGSPNPGKATRRRRKNKAAGIVSGFGARPIVDDISEQPDSASEAGDVDFTGLSMYEVASSQINSFLADQTSVCRLTLLQSLIVELGLASSSPPASLTAAKAVLKSHAFLHVGEYLDARQRGPAAVQGVMYPSKTSLIKDLKKKRNPVSLKWVKQTGLQVLLVSCYHS